MTRSDIERLPSALTVELAIDGKAYRGVAVNVSPKGLCLRTNAPLRDEQALRMRLGGPDGHAIEASGMVRWVVEMSPMIQPTFPIEAGVSIDGPNPSFLDLFSRENEMFVDFRNNPRIPHQFRVEISGPGMWETTFALNLGRRGLFVRTDQVLQPGQLVELRMFIPRIPDPVHVRAEVVHTVSRTRATEVGAEPGVGLRLGTLTPGHREAFLSYVSDLEQRYR